ncbi:MAG: hypothetical protein KDD42_01340 [Bdellovibrionales bacterium]|nr:hypothetical protein [Bdellovibrionales bacterium]
MSLKQKFSDAILLLKTERRYKFIVGLAVIGILFLLFDEPNKPGQRKQNARKQRTENSKIDTVANEEAYRDLVVAFSEDLNEIKGMVKENVAEDKERDKRISEFEEKTAVIFKKILARIADNEVATGGMPGEAGYNGEMGLPAPVDMAMPTTEEGAIAPVQSDELEEFGDTTVQEAPPPVQSGPQKVAFIGAGDSVRVKLLAGVRAPTDGTPYPVLFKLVSDVYGPDGSALPIGEARLIAAAQGSLTDSRVLFRLTKLNMRLPDGRRKVVDVDGWVVGEDGLRGMQGIPIDPIGKGLAAGALTGFASGVARGFASAESDTIRGGDGDLTTIVSGDVWTYGAANGLEGSANQWSRILNDRVKALVPHVEVFSGREATAVFADSIALKGLFEAMEEESDLFSPLD